MLSKANRFLGAILLVAGTTIGAGMLALPVITGSAGFFPALVMMTAVFLFMLMTAFYLLEVNLKMKGESNFISMVHKTLNRPGEMVAWVFYLLLLYALTAAYLVGCSQIIIDFLGNKISEKIVPFIVFLLFGSFIYFGTQVVDIINRFLMIALIASYLLLMFVGFFHIDLSLLSHTSWPCLLGATSVVVTSFGYHIIIPTLTNYLEHDKKLLKKAILIGSLIPFTIYIAWQLLVMGIIPVSGECSLTKAEELGLQATIFLNTIIGSPLIGLSARLFAFFAIVTSLLGVTLSLTDFLSDGLKIKKSSMGKFFLILLTFIPPLFFATMYPKGFIVALKYAGICVVVLLALLPCLMAWRMREGKKKMRVLPMIGLSFLLLALEVILL